MRETVPMPNAAEASVVANALSRLLGYLRTWQNPDGLFGGTIATWWSSTLETAVPHPMNQFPMILGFLELHRAGIRGGNWLDEARRIGDGLIASIQPDGMLQNSWGDIPGKGTGTVIYAGSALALAELFRDTKEDRYLQGARRVLDTIEQRWTWRGRNVEGCANQAFKWCEAMATYGRLSRETAYVDHARWLAREYLAQQIRRGLMAGAFYQSRTDDRLITVYQGKCLVPLVRFWEQFGECEFLNAAMALADYVLCQEVEPGMFVNYREPIGWCYRVVRNLPRRLDFRVFKRTQPTYKLWRWVPSKWFLLEYPSFIARSGDTLRGLWMLARHESRFRKPAARLTQRLLSFQMVHGGFPNTVGYCGRADRQDWQDICCPTRWNAYVFLFLCVLLSEASPGGAIQEQPSTAVWESPTGPDRDQRYRETPHDIQLHVRDSLVARLRKPSGTSEFLQQGWEGDLTDQRDRKFIKVRS